MCFRRNCRRRWTALSKSSRRCAHGRKHSGLTLAHWSNRFEVFASTEAWSRIQPLLLTSGRTSPRDGALDVADRPILKITRSAGRGPSWRSPELDLGDRGVRKAVHGHARVDTHDPQRECPHVCEVDFRRLEYGDVILSPSIGECQQTVRRAVRCRVASLGWDVSEHALLSRCGRKDILVL